MFRHILSAALANCEDELRLQNTGQLQFPSFQTNVHWFLFREKKQKTNSTKVTLRTSAFSRKSGSEVWRPNAPWQDLTYLPEVRNSTCKVKPTTERGGAGRLLEKGARLASVCVYISTFPSLNKLWNTCEQLHVWNLHAAAPHRNTVVIWWSSWRWPRFGAQTWTPAHDQPRCISADSPGQSCHGCTGASQI